MVVLASDFGTNIDAALLERGYPQAYLDNIPESLKESLYNQPELIFVEAQICVHNVENGDDQIFSISENNINPRGQIPTDELTLTWGVYKYTNSNNIHVIYTYKWTDLPFNRYEDPIGVSWDSKYFALVDDSFHKVDEYRTNMFGKIAMHTQSDEWAYANASSSSVTWYADLVGYLTVGVDMLIGYGEFTLFPKQSNFTTTLYGHYVHAKSNASISLEIPQYGLGFSVTGGSSYDELGNQITFTYD